MAQLTLTPTELRRLSIAAQCLEAPRPNPTKADVLDTIRRITCLQVDPINVVARTQLLVLFSRLGAYDPADLEALLWDDKALFEYWAHAASIIPADDFALFRPQMRRNLTVGSERLHDWLKTNEPFRRNLLDELTARGPLYVEEIESRAVESWPHKGGWGGGSDVGIMLEVLWYRGQVSVTRRLGNGFGLKKQWGLMAHQVGERAAESPLTQPEAERRAVERALPALGAARLRDVNNYFIRKEYKGLKKTLAGLEAGGVIQQVAVRDGDGVDSNTQWPGPWYLHNDMLPELERIRRGDWRPQTVLLSPFDNLIADRDRTELLFGMRYRVEIYTPAARRQYGYYNMPILHGDRIIGRVDPKMDRKAGRLVVNAVHLEPGVALDGETRAAVDGAIASLAGFLGAEGIDGP